jgi:hypothetical protein
MTFNEYLNAITDPGPGDPYPVTGKQIREISALVVFAAKKRSDRLAGLLVEAPSALLDSVKKWTRAEGLSVTVNTDLAQEEGNSAVLIELTSEDFSEMFCVLADDIIKVLSDAADPQEAVRVLHGRLESWQLFLRRSGPRGLRREDRIGLFGELTVLRDLFLKHLEAGTSVKAWTGWDWTSRDFRYKGLGIEVKTITAEDFTSIYISSGEQLDDEGFDRLILNVLWAEQNDTGAETLNSLVESVRGMIDGAARIEFDTNLIRAGYHDKQGHLYADEHYDLREIYYFDVRDEFPRLVPAEIPEGIKKISYVISANACRPFALGPADIDTEILSRKDP